MTLTATGTREQVGVYGMRGWTTRKQIRRILQPFMDARMRTDSPSEALHSFQTYRDLDARGAQLLLSTLPLANLSERQNLAPTCEAMLKACAVGRGAVRVSGYAVGPARTDERVTVDGLIYQSDAECILCTYPSSAVENPQKGSKGCAHLWRRFRSELQLQSALDSPDEFQRVRLETVGRPGTSQKNAWWLWWD